MVTATLLLPSSFLFVNISLLEEKRAFDIYDIELIGSYATRYVWSAKSDNRTAIGQSCLERYNI